MKLETILRQLGASDLSELVGHETLEAAHKIFKQSITETKMIELLLERSGTQVFGNSALRTQILSCLDIESLNFIHSGEKGIHDVKNNTHNGLSWSRNSQKARRLIDLFEMDESYLPPEKQTQETYRLLTPSFPLFEYQKKIKDRAVDIVRPPKSKLLIHMPTGAGKTKTTAELLVDFWRGTAHNDGFIIWLAHSEELCSQASETLARVWESRGDFELPLFNLWGSSACPEPFGDVGLVVASLQKIYSMWTSSNPDVRKRIQELKLKSRVIVIDEAHKAIAPTYKLAINSLTNMIETRVIGLTATPGRGADPLENANLAAFFDNTKITLQDSSGKNMEDPIGYLQDHKFLAKINRKKIPTNVEIDLTDAEREYLETFLDLPSSVLKKLGKSHERNALILSELAKLSNQGASTIVFACSVAHAHLLNDLCKIRDISARAIDGGTASKDRRDWLDQYKKGEFSVLINYGVLSTGFDAPNTNAVLISRPTKSIVLYSQMIGRGIRGEKMGGNKICQLIDLEDNLRDFPSESQAFNHFNWDE